MAAVFLDPRNGRVLDEVVVGDTLNTLFGSSVSVSPDRGRVAVTTITTATVLDAVTREEVGRISTHRWSFSDSTWSADGRKLILAAESWGDGDYLGALAVVDTDTWKVDRMVPVEPGSPQVLEWSHDRATLAVGVNFTSSVMLFDEQLAPQRTLDLGGGGDVFDLSFSPDGRFLATGRVAGVLTVLGTDDWKPRHEPAQMHADPITDVEWLPDNDTVVSTSRDEIVSLYDVERDLTRGGGLPAATRPGDGYTFLLPAPEDEVIVFNEGGPGHRYPLDADGWLALACEVAGRDLTPAEWGRYLPATPHRHVCEAS